MKETRPINTFFEKKKKILIWGYGPFWAQKLHFLMTLDPLEDFFFKIWHNERGQKVDENDINNFPKNFWLPANGLFWSQKWCFVITLDWL